MKLGHAKVIVTGGSDGYGRGIAQILAKAGAEVWITGRNEEKLDAAAKELGVHAVRAEVSSGADWDRLLAETGDPDVLVNNAGTGGKIAPVDKQSDEEICRTIAVNLIGAILGCRRVAARMKQRQRGVIINISSVCASYAWPGWSVYTAAKAGISKFSHGLYTELRPYGVRVSCIAPSWGQTGFNRAAQITGASEDPELSSRCIAPEELGEIVRSIIELPDHLAVPDLTLQPMIQDICPM